ncbi:uncharacterized protein LOC120320467 [Drosophila yakuba]|uniref:uncharacterized protein LOC120320467 n=1 Tax=Drosophila yakuba TaxID=7245 RepID=UPI0019307663|nr:uncharacterized protein LOC120320467 [Drosophila yakuba]
MQSGGSVRSSSINIARTAWRTSIPEARAGVSVAAEYVGTLITPCYISIGGKSESGLLARTGPSRRQSRRPTSSNPASRQCSPTLQRPSVNLRFDIGDKRFDVRAMVDECFTSSRIDGSLAEAMALPILGVGDERVCRATLIPIHTETPRIEVVFHVEEQLRMRTSARELPDAAKTVFTNLIL